MTSLELFALLDEVGIHQASWRDLVMVNSSRRLPHDLSDPFLAEFARGFDLIALQEGSPRWFCKVRAASASATIHEAKVRQALSGFRGLSLNVPSATIARGPSLLVQASPFVSGRSLSARLGRMSAAEISALLVPFFADLRDLREFACSVVHLGDRERSTAHAASSVLQYARSERLISEQNAQTLEYLFSHSEQAHARPQHGDLWAQNIVRDGQITYLLDFEGFGNVSVVGYDELHFLLTSLWLGIEPRNRNLESLRAAVRRARPLARVLGEALRAVGVTEAIADASFGFYLLHMSVELYRRSDRSLRYAEPFLRTLEQHLQSVSTGATSPVVELLRASGAPGAGPKTTSISRGREFFAHIGDSPALIGVASRALSALTPICSTVFMMHRFTDPGIGAAGDSPLVLRKSLEQFRKARIELVPIDEIVRQVVHGELARHQSVAFTVDDGYADFLTVAAPIFAEFDCPVSVFLSTDITSNRHWYWWDAVEYSLLRTKKTELLIPFVPDLPQLKLTSLFDRRIEARRLMEALKFVPDETRVETLRSLPSLTDVELPQQPPDQYRTLTWTEVRQLESSGVRFGPHGCSHPVLSMVSDTRARREIFDSWSVLQERCSAPVPVFCYPNGTTRSFSKRDCDLVRDAGMMGALTYIRRHARRGSELVADPFAVPRFEFPHSAFAGLRTATGRR